MISATCPCFSSPALRAFETILKYLSSRPYAEVFQLVAMLVGLKPAENAKAKDEKKDN